MTVIMLIPRYFADSVGRIQNRSAVVWHKYRMRSIPLSGVQDPQEKIDELA